MREWSLDADEGLLDEFLEIDSLGRNGWVNDVMNLYRDFESK